MQETVHYCKRLIEVDLPIKRISAHARREKSIRRGHISTLHIWWARRPLAACRSILCASLWPDPVDELCNEDFRIAARNAMKDWANSNSLWKEDLESFHFFSQVGNGKIDLTDNFQLRQALLHFIADFANWDNSTETEYLKTSRVLTQVAHETLGGVPGTRPMVIDPFAGGGAIPYEALRIGANTFASDLNPVAVLLNKVVLEYVPTYGHKLADDIKKWGKWIKTEAEKELSEYYSKEPDGNTAIAYLWARTVSCEGPGCGVHVPLMRSLWLAKKTGRGIGLQFIPNKTEKRIDFQIINQTPHGWFEQEDNQKQIQNPKFDGNVKRGNAVCPVCGFTTDVKSVRRQLSTRNGGANDAQLVCVIYTKPQTQGRFYRLPNINDLNLIKKVENYFEHASLQKSEILKLIPEEEISLNEIRRISVPIYGMKKWRDLFSLRQILSLITFSKYVNRISEKYSVEEKKLADAVQTCLAMAISRQADRDCSLCRWISQNENIGYTFGRQAIGMMWDFVEAPALFSGGGWSGIIDDICETILLQPSGKSTGQVEKASATQNLLPDDYVQFLFTDPPYYDAVPYAHLSDFFYVWLKSNLSGVHPNLFQGKSVPKENEIVVDRPHSLSTSNKDVVFYERELKKAFAEGRRVLTPEGIGVIVFASKTTTSWEAILQAILDAGFIITGSWPLDTEREARISAYGQARLVSSVHITIRPRENKKGHLEFNVGDWRDVLHELPIRIHEWMSRLISEGVVGADAIFACLGPALEIFSRYSKVEEADGTVVKLRDYLEKVWAAVGKEAFSNIFSGADANGFEEDARLTAIWFWAIKGATDENTGKIEVSDNDEQDEEKEQDEETPSKNNQKTSGYTMEYDAIRKLAQGLGVNLENLNRPDGIISIKGGTATLNSVLNRTPYLLGLQPTLFDNGRAISRTHLPKNKTIKMKSVTDRQPTLIDIEPAIRYETRNQPVLFNIDIEDERSLLQRLLDNGTTTLDRLHQAMLLFSNGQTALIESFLYETGMHKSEFWQLAQSLSALYPVNSVEKRLVDGLLAFTKNKRIVNASAAPL